MADESSKVDKAIGYAVKEMVKEDYDRAGVLPPALAIEPQELLKHAEDVWGLEVN